MQTVDEITDGILAKVSARMSAPHRVRDMQVTMVGMSATGEGMLGCQVRKVDEDRQLVFGWASVCSVDGEDIVDKQGDIIPEHELENAVYEYNLYCRKQGDMHERLGVGRLVESMVFTVEKQQALGIDLGMVGWWVGFKVDDPAVWKRIKGGDLPEFSIGGKAIRDEV